MKNKKILVSIVTVTYNSVRTIEQTINSVLSQTYDDIEYIVIDGGSTDGTVDIIKKYSDRIAYWKSEPDGGIYDAMNKALGLANGNIIGIINSDDFYEVNTVGQVVDVFLRNEKIEIVAGKQRTFLQDDNNEKVFIEKANFSYNHIDIGASICHPTIFVKKSAYEKYGKFSLRYSYVADSELILRMKSLGARIEIIDKVLANYRLGGFSSKISLRMLIEKNEIRMNYCGYSEINFLLLRDVAKYFLAKIIPDGILQMIKKKRIGNEF